MWRHSCEVNHNGYEGQAMEKAQSEGDKETRMTNRQGCQSKAGKKKGANRNSMGGGRGKAHRCT